jgi:hypothetical protein
VVGVATGEIGQGDLDGTRAVYRVGTELGVPVAARGSWRRARCALWLEPAALHAAHLFDTKPSKQEHVLTSEKTINLQALACTQCQRTVGTRLARTLW